MGRRQVLAVVMTVAGFRAVVASIHQELLHVAPGYDETITTGWGSRLSYEEYLLTRLGGASVTGMLAAFRWKYAAVLPVAVDGVRVGYPLVAVSHHVRELGFYTTIQTFDGAIRLILGAEPLLFVAGSPLLLSAGVVAW